METYTLSTDPLDYLDCFAVPDAGSIIDVVNPETGRTMIFGRTLEEVQRTDPGAVRMRLADWASAKAAKQDAPGRWELTTEERYDNLLGALPPAARRGSAFLVGEASDHHAGTGQPRFQACCQRGDSFFAYSRPMSHAEFVAEFGPCSLHYS